MSDSEGSMPAAGAADDNPKPPPKPPELARVLPSPEEIADWYAGADCESIDNLFNNLVVMRFDALVMQIRKQELIPQHWQILLPAEIDEEAFDRLTLESGCRDTCWLFDQAWLHDRLGQREQAIALYERVRQQGFILRDVRANPIEILHAMIRLGPLYDELGKSAEAIEAYQRMVDQWADGDVRGQETVQRFRERITALGGSTQDLVGSTQ